MTNADILLGQLANGASVCAVLGVEGWGLNVHAPGCASAHQDRPVCAEVWDGKQVKAYHRGYDTVVREAEGFVGRSRLVLTDSASATLIVEDYWSVPGDTLQMARTVRVEGAASGGFLTSITLELNLPLTWLDVDAFAPGMIYGSENIAPHAIGSVSHYLTGVRSVRIREDRLPAPLLGLALRDGTSVAVLNPTPRGNTTREDSRDLEGTPLVDARFTFAALGSSERDGHLEVGLYFPGTEGEITYLADTPFAGGQFGDNQRRRWRGRYHPFQDGFEQRYAAAFRFGSCERDQTFRRNAWHWAWSALEPRVAKQDLAATREALGDMLEASIQQVDNRAGPTHVVDSVSGAVQPSPVLMGFTGRAVETGELLLRSASDLSGQAAVQRRARALSVLETFARLPVTPPQAEGLDLHGGQLSSGVRPDFYVRALAEGGKFMLRAYERELAKGEAHPHWLTWCVQLADWLLTQELPAGGFPRAWRDLTAEVVADDPRSSNAVVPFFVPLAHVTGKEIYLQAALRAAELCWALGGSRGGFVGGTLDNANVVDKEAGTLALEAYLALYDATSDSRWLVRAEDAADFAETWIYLWNVPMPADEADADLHWKQGVTTVGAQLIATGHSLTDTYMTWDVANYAKLARLTGDPHYFEVAKLLFHNTKVMLALPGRPFDLVGPGWQQEHWSFAPPRGRGIHRFWLPWVTCSHLEGLYSLEDFDPQLYYELARPVER